MTSKKPRKVKLRLCRIRSAWSRLGGSSILEFDGDTSYGNAVELRLEFSEFSLRRLAKQLRQAFRELKEQRDQMNRANLDVFGEG